MKRTEMTFAQRMEFGNPVSRATLHSKRRALIMRRHRVMVAMEAVGEAEEASPEALDELP